MSGLIVPFGGFVPRVDRSAFVAVNATLVGDVEIGANASIWFGCILRGDGPGIRIGENTNLQDGTVVHIAKRGLMTVVGRNVSVGHMALLHACEIQDDAFVGMRASVLDGAVVESGAMVAAGALVTPGKIVRRGELWAGNPARKMRDLTGKDFETFGDVVDGYVKLSRRYRMGERQAAE
ncbi:MAG: gamma carbonic anhydrase family protein [Reyranella sp.]|uniref:gamma carbonic anhydrase family protein n=1 Tax=Reyranella sp. TaxID=1929291 RepID=UPI003D0F5602